MNFSYVGLQVSHCKPSITLGTLLSQLKMNCIIVIFQLGPGLELLATTWFWTLVLFHRTGIVHVLDVPVHVLHHLATQTAWFHDRLVDSSFVVLVLLFVVKAFKTERAFNFFGGFSIRKTFLSVKKDICN